MTRSILTGPIVVGSDESADARLATVAAADLARRSGVPLHLVHAKAGLPGSIHGAAFEAALLERSHADAESVVARQAAAIQRLGAALAGAHTPEGRAADAVLAVAGRIGASLIVVGSRGLGGFRRIFLGSVSEAIVHSATCPVLVMRGGPRSWPPNRILVGDDGSPECWRAESLAVDLARTIGAPVALVRALPPRLLTERTPGDVNRRRDAERYAAKELARRAAKMTGSRAEQVQAIVACGDAAAVLSDTATALTGPALVVVGSRGLGRVKRIALGSTSTKVLRGYRGPVLICPFQRAPAGRRAAT